VNGRSARGLALTVVVVTLVVTAGCVSVVGDGDGDERTTVDRTVQSTPVEDPRPREQIEDSISQGVRISGVTGELDSLVESEEPADYADLTNRSSDSLGIRFIWKTTHTCGLAYNAVVEHPTDDGTSSTTVVRSGEPSGDPIQVTETVPMVVGDGSARDTVEATVTVTAWPRREPAEECTASERSAQDQIRDDGAEALSAGGLSELVRHWNGSEDERTWAGYVDPSRHDDGNTMPVTGYGEDKPPTPVGDALNETVRQRGFTYNLYVVYENVSVEGERTLRPVVFRGVPTGEATVVSETVTLRDDQSLTGPAADGRTLAEYDTERDGDDGYFPIPDAHSDDRYNEVTVYLVVW